MGTAVQRHSWVRARALPGSRYLSSWVICSGNDFVCHATRPETARQISREELVRESQIDVARFIERFQLIGSQGKLQAREVVVELRELARFCFWLFGAKVSNV